MGIVYPGERNPNWQGGRSIASTGYVLVKMRGHRLADVRGYVYEHRLVAEAKIGRPLKAGEQVHHLNGCKTDNRPENLEVVPSIAHHRVLERTVGLGRQLPGEENPMIDCACGCGARLALFDREGRRRTYISGHNMLRR